MFGEQLMKNKELLVNLEVFEENKNATKVLFVDGKSLSDVYMIYY